MVLWATLYLLLSVVAWLWAFRFFVREFLEGEASELEGWDVASAAVLAMMLCIFWPLFAFRLLAQRPVMWLARRFVDD